MCLWSQHKGQKPKYAVVWLSSQSFIPWKRNTWTEPVKNLFITWSFSWLPEQNLSSCFTKQLCLTFLLFTLPIIIPIWFTQKWKFGNYSPNLIRVDKQLINPAHSSFSFGIKFVDLVSKSKAKRTEELTVFVCSIAILVHPQSIYPVIYICIYIYFLYVLCTCTYMHMYKCTYTFL